ncbi:hypothetical protein ACFQZS_16075 [Mucilaginibacter calamicampi]|uniref:Uncharacterized protein n=1 Tax=Mucilaginibacter calamicampi TaxID=1302352 RepID=A0ABW2YZL2_9SPHI
MMKLVLTLFIVIILRDSSDYLNSVWVYPVAKGCVNTLKLKAKGKADSYDCELDYTFNCTYKIVKDTLFLTEPDDSHEEDGGKVIFHRYKYLIRNKALFCISSGELVKGKWIDKKIKSQNPPDWKRVK